MVALSPGRLGAQEKSEDLFWIKGLKKNAIEYEHYTCQLSNPLTRPISDIEIWDKAIGPGDPLNYFFWHDDPKPARQLLEIGFARLRSPENASSDLRNAQIKAQNLRLGMWKGGTSIAQATDNPSAESGGGRIATVVRFIKNVPTLAWALLGTLSVLGISVAQLGSFLHKKYYIEKRVNMLVIGEEAAGKTALLLRLHDPRISPEILLGTQPTMAIVKSRLRDPIPYSGRFQIYPQPVDVPGSKYGMALDSLHDKYDVLLIVLSHNKERAAKEPDVEYIAHQLELVRILVAGAIDSKRMRKPKALILFISKFELLSQLPPWDSGAAAARRRVDVIFGGHITTARDAAKRNNIPFTNIVGSSVANWNCESVTKFIADSIYARR